LGVCGEEVGLLLRRSREEWASKEMLLAKSDDELGSLRMVKLKNTASSL
jgi:hypothetical protein